MPLKIAISLLALVTVACVSGGDDLGADVDTPIPVSEATAVELDATGERLVERGIDRYRFRSTVTIPGRATLSSATYDGRVAVAPSVTHVTSEGIVGDFEVYLSATTSVYRYAGHAWQESRRPWRWSPIGPIPTYLVAGTIAQLALDRGPETQTIDLHEGVGVTHFVTTLDDGTRVEVWISSDGILRRVSVSQPDPAGDVRSEWSMYDVNGDFAIEIPDTDG